MLQAMMLFVATLVMAQANAATDAMTDAQAEKIRDRIKPIAEVCVQGDDCGGPVIAASTGPRSGEEVFNGTCTSCHTAGIAGAPKKGDVAAWDKRLSKGLAETLAVAKKGLNAMPAKGLCMDCSDDELTAAIKFMSGT
ncbi:Cytochrome c5 [Oleispira antarctica RB-8]|uniref:Cytochrome c5 n=1 Tax=Oleispira antarctica RB-8 TaxID=698738 RepID=R4YSK0_OLEAN|nr:Cytochrome c5 [Oleispira antarctica RB-8]|tara:strand:+ start:316 stop:729 length:414 start_codon:yes stop_codon:yes gene_type:complete